MGVRKKWGIIDEIGRKKRKQNIKKQCINENTKVPKPTTGIVTHKTQRCGL
jgi:hypothetical protein